MKIRRITRYLALLAALFILSVSAVSAQEIDIDTMSDEQLMVLLVQITDRLGLEMPQPKASDEVTPETTGTPYASEAAEPTSEPVYFESWMNKKLVVGALPSYMFIQPTQEPQEESTPGTPGKKHDNDGGSCPVGEPCRPGANSCFWNIWEGQCLCFCG